MRLTEHSPFWQRMGLVRPPLWQAMHMALALHKRSSSSCCSPSSSRCTASSRPSCVACQHRPGPRSHRHE